MQWKLTQVSTYHGGYNNMTYLSDIGGLWPRTWHDCILTNTRTDRNKPLKITTQCVSSLPVNFPVRQSVYIALPCVRETSCDISRDGSVLPLQFIRRNFRNIHCPKVSFWMRSRWIWKNLKADCWNIQLEHASLDFRTYTWSQHFDSKFNRVILSRTT